MTDRDFNKSFLISLGIHVWIAGLAFLAGEVFKSAFKNNDIEIIRSAVRVDVVGLPKFTVEELKNMAPEVAAAPPVEVKGNKEEVKPEAEDVIKENDLVLQEQEKNKKKKASFLNLISDYSKAKVAPKEKKKGGKTGEANSKEINTLILEGNRLSKGTALTGEFSDQENSAFAQYVQALPDQVRKHWNLPQFLKDKNLKCRARMFLSSTGTIIKTEVVEPSGDAEYDKRAVDAIRAAAPFAQPSPEVAPRLSKYGIILGFPL